MIIIKLFILLNCLLFVNSNINYNNIDYKTNVLTYMNKLFNGFHIISYIDCCGYYFDNEKYKCSDKFKNKDNSILISDKLKEKCIELRYLNYINNTLDDLSELIEKSDYYNYNKVIKEKINSLDYLNIIYYPSYILTYIITSYDIDLFNINKLKYIRVNEIKNINKTMQIIPNINKKYIKTQHLFI
tara:strand:- start:2938 stop:3495 length:558 start_codon:yes stop_codon:yes gene_type:complete